MIFKIKTDNLVKTIDTDDFIEKDIDVILDSEIYYLRKEERNMFGTTSAIVEVEEQKWEQKNTAQYQFVKLKTED